nr:FAD/NAD(P)-binding protein [Mesorhizobium sp. M1E.F.Ca.ET.041.01.1.1]
MTRRTRPRLFDRPSGPPPKRPRFEHERLRGQARHFVQWLETRSIPVDDPATYFAARRLYGEYLEHLLKEPREDSGSRLHVIDEECVELVQHDGYVELRLANGSSIVAERCVLATGHDRSAGRGQSLLAQVDAGRTALPERTDRVLVIGTSLSMVDTCLSLLLRGPAGEIVAVSRRGLLPAVHRKNQPIVLQRSEVPLGCGPAHFVTWFRQLVRAAEARGGDWRDVVDGLRPHNQSIWQSWSITQRRRFFRHLKAWWDIHRHRMAPQVSERLSEAIGRGQLRVIAGRVRDVTPVEGGFSVRLHCRDGQRTEEIRAGQIYDCAGLVADPDKSTNPLIRSLLAGGMARADALRIGLAVATDGALINRNGRRNDLLYAVGPLTRGTFLEIEAIPDIRVQCQRLAGALLARQASGLPRV